MAIQGTVNKGTGETFYVGFTYSAPDLDTGETITTATVAATTGITVGATVIDGAEVTAPVSGGTANTNYTVTFTVTTSAGNIFVDSLLVRVT